MKCLLVTLIALVAAANASDGLRARWTVLGISGFYDLPKTESNAIKEGWTLEPKRPENHLPSLKLYSYSNKIFSILYDDNGFLGGVQVCYPAANVTDVVYDWGVQGFIEWTPEGSDNLYYCNQQYFVNEEYLAIDKEERLATRDTSQLYPLESVFVTGTNRELMEIGRDVDWVNASNFTEQACIPTMGRHYYLNVAPSMVCNAETMYPWFLLYHSGRLVATALVAYGKMPEDPVRDWHERPPRSSVQVIVPRAPECLYDLTEAPGMLSIHIYYVSNVYSLTCLDNIFG